MNSQIFDGMKGRREYEIHPFVLSTPFLYSLKTSEKGFLIFSGAEKVYIGNKWAKQNCSFHSILSDRHKTDKNILELKYTINSYLQELETSTGWVTWRKTPILTCFTKPFPLKLLFDILFLFVFHH